MVLHRNQFSNNVDSKRYKQIQISIAGAAELKLCTSNKSRRHRVLFKVVPRYSLTSCLGFMVLKFQGLLIILVKFFTCTQSSLYARNHFKDHSFSLMEIVMQLKPKSDWVFLSEGRIMSLKSKVI